MEGVAPSILYRIVQRTPEVGPQEWQMKWANPTVG
jgi:hypothetical protein